MSDNMYGNPRKYIVARSEKAFKASTHSKTHLQQSEITKIES